MNPEHSVRCPQSLLQPSRFDQAVVSAAKESAQGVAHQALHIVPMDKIGAWRTRRPTPIVVYKTQPQARSQRLSRFRLETFDAVFLANGIATEITPPFAPGHMQKDVEA